MRPHYDAANDPDTEPAETAAVRPGFGRAVAAVGERRIKQRRTVDRDIPALKTLAEKMRSLLDDSLGQQLRLIEENRELRRRLYEETRKNNVLRGGRANSGMGSEEANVGSDLATVAPQIKRSIQ